VSIGLIESGLDEGRKRIQAAREHGAHRSACAAGHNPPSHIVVGPNHGLAEAVASPGALDAQLAIPAGVQCVDHVVPASDREGLAGLERRFGTPILAYPVAAHSRNM